MQDHGKHFLMGLVGTVQGRLGWAGDEARKLAPEIERLVSEARWLECVEFDTIHYIMRFGAEEESKISCRKKRKYQELEVASQVSMQELHEVFLNREKLNKLLCKELARVFQHLEKKYKLPHLPTLNSYFEIKINA
jgi:hypothetical protein